MNFKACDRMEVGQSELGDNIKAMRKRAGLSQEDLAGKAKIAHRALQRIEGGDGNPTLNTLLAIAKALGTTIDGLTGEPDYAKTRVAKSMVREARAARLEPLSEQPEASDDRELIGTRLIEAEKLLLALVGAEEVRRLAALLILTGNRQYLEALGRLPGSARYIRALELIV